MHILVRFLLLPAYLLLGFIPALHAVTLELSANQFAFSPGNTLSLSFNIIPTDDTKLQTDIYVAVVLPDNAILTLDRNLAWKATVEPMLTALALARIQASDFYSLQLPINLPIGKYTFYLVVVPTGDDPINSSTWLGYATAPIVFRQSPILQWRGVNLSGAEFGEGHLPGIYGSDYIYPSVASVDYFKAKGMNLVRLPFRWERLQPSLSQPFDMAELARLQTFVSSVTAKGVAVLLDPHNFGRYRGQVVGSSALPYAAYADFWSRLSAIFKDNTNVVFGLMNEPHEMPTETWVNAANSAIQGIRATGARNTIMVPGNAWTGAWSWAQNWYGTANAEAMNKIVDPGNNMVLEVHQYLDSDSSGTSPTCVSTSIGVERLEIFTNWLRINGKRGFLGEFAGGNNATCNQAVANMLATVEANADVWLGWAWWSAGPWWGDYMFSIEPGSNNMDKPQMAVLTGEPSVKVVKSRGSVQCEESGAAPELMQNELTTLGIAVLALSCGTDGLLHVAVCGAPDGRINIFAIPQSKASQAHLLGFLSLSDLPSAHEIPCR